MKLTVGPLDPGVYWRRRAVVLGGLLVALLVLTVAYSCSDSTSGTKRTASPAGSTPAPGPTGVQSSSVPLIPTTGSPSDQQSSAAASASSAAPAGGTGGPQSAVCADTDILVSAAPEAATTRLQQPVKLTLKIRNTSNRVCSRDVGATAQELYIQQGGVKVWSSDACDAKESTDIRTFEPNIEAQFYVSWDAKLTTAGCATKPWAPEGDYQVFARLATRVSEPVILKVTK
jgi:hypothetical protein